MEITGLDGRTYRLKLSNHGPKTRPSSYHLRARHLLKRIYPAERILEEVHLPGCKTDLYVDFLLPQHRLAVEVHGEQHYSYIEYFHKNKLEYLAAKARDNAKRELFQLNNIALVELPYDRDDADWHKRIITATTEREAGGIQSRSRPIREGTGPASSEEPGGLGGNTTPGVKQE